MYITLIQILQMVVGTAGKLFNCISILEGSSRVQFLTFLYFIISSSSHISGMVMHSHGIRELPHSICRVPASSVLLGDQLGAVQPSVERRAKLQGAHTECSRRPLDVRLVPLALLRFLLCLLPQAQGHHEEEEEGELILITRRTRRLGLPGPAS